MQRMKTDLYVILNETSLREANPLFECLSFIPSENDVIFRWFVLAGFDESQPSDVIIRRVTSHANESCVTCSYLSVRQQNDAIP